MKQRLLFSLFIVVILILLIIKKCENYYEPADELDFASIRTDWGSR